MLRRYLLLAGVVLIAACLVDTVQAQETCNIAPNAVWTSIAENCAQIERDEVCYGNPQIAAEVRSPDVVFEQIGDVASASQIETLTLSALNASDQTWGAALLRLQASSIVESENITLIAFGNVQITNAVQPESTPVAITVTVDGRMRGAPIINDTNVLTEVPAGTQLQALGRDASGTWVYADFDGTSGWISTQVFTSAGDILTLSVLPDTPVFASPMEAIYLSTGTGQPDCPDVPDDGILLQSPEDASEITLSVNGVNLQMGSTLYLTAEDGVLQVFVLEGIATVTALDNSQIVPAGSTVTVPLTAEGTAPAAVPSEPQPYEAERLVNLPVGLVEDQVSVLPEAVAVSPPLSPEEIDAAVTSYLSGLSLQAGTYTITRVDAVIQNGTGNCPPDVTFTRQHDGSSDMLFGEFPRLADGVFGADVDGLNAARNPDENYIGEASQITLTSSTSLTWFSVSNGNGSPAYCEFRYVGTRTGP